MMHCFRHHPRNCLNTCGYVGQLEKVFNACRTDSSARISNVPYSASNPFKRSIVCLLKPHFGVAGSPFKLNINVTC